MEFQAAAFQPANDYELDRLGQVIDGTHWPTPGVSIWARCRRPE